MAPSPQESFCQPPVRNVLIWEESFAISFLHSVPWEEFHGGFCKLPVTKQNLVAP